MATPEAEPAFAIETASATPNGDPLPCVDVTATITNYGYGPAISTAGITLVVTRDGEKMERYPLAEGKALPQGSTEIGQRYIPVDGWQPGAYGFAVEVAAVDGGTEAILATVEIPEGITVPQPALRERHCPIGRGAA